METEQVQVAESVSMYVKAQRRQVRPLMARPAWLLRSPLSRTRVGMVIWGARCTPELLHTVARAPLQCQRAPYRSLSTSGPARPPLPREGLHFPRIFSFRLPRERIREAWLVVLLQAVAWVPLTSVKWWLSGDLL